MTSHQECSYEPIDVAVVIMTYDRVADAQANIETVRCAWTPGKGFGDVYVVHVHNGPEVWYTPDFSGVDADVSASPNPGHFEGAAELVDAGAQAVAEHWSQVRYAVFLASDTWLYDPAWIRGVLADMRADEMRLAAASWEISDFVHGLARIGGKHLLPASGLSTDCFVLDIPWARNSGMVPLRYIEFLEQYGDLLNYFQELPLVERFFEGRYLQAVRRSLRQQRWAKDPWGSEGPRQARRMLRVMSERGVDPQGRWAPSHKGHWPNLGLVTSEDARVKQAIVRANPRLRGASLDRLRRDDDTAWFQPRRLVN
ncbi:MAG: hypothetical protein WAL50_08115 [Kineosporiaceae bacterium]